MRAHAPVVLLVAAAHAAALVAGFALRDTLLAGVLLVPPSLVVVVLAAQCALPALAEGPATRFSLLLVLAQCYSVAAVAAAVYSGLARAALGPVFYSSCALFVLTAAATLMLAHALPRRAANLRPPGDNWIDTSKLFYPPRRGDNLV